MHRFFNRFRYMAAFVICAKHVFSLPVMNEIERKHLILVLKSYEVEN